MLSHVHRSTQSESSGEVDGGRGLAHPALLVSDRHDPRRLGTGECRRIPVEDLVRLARGREDRGLVVGHPSPFELHRERGEPAAVSVPLFHVKPTLDTSPSGLSETDARVRGIGSHGPPS